MIYIEVLEGTTDIKCNNPICIFLEMLSRMNARFQCVFWTRIVHAVFLRNNLHKNLPFNDDLMVT